MNSFWMNISENEKYLEESSDLTMLKLQLWKCVGSSTQDLSTWEVAPVSVHGRRAHVVCHQLSFVGYCYIKLNCFENLLFILLFLFSLCLGVFFCSCCFSGALNYVIVSKDTSTKSKTPSAKSCCLCNLIYNYTAVCWAGSLSFS